MFSRKNKLVFILIVIGVGLFVHLNVVVHQDATVDNATAVTREIIGNDSTGSVEVIKNVGNPDGVKVAYVVGVHPLENDTHQTLLNLLPETDSLNCCYDIYVIHVNQDFSAYGQLSPDDQPGRAEGQDLALKYVYPEIVNGSYKACVDVHAHGGVYKYDTFVFCAIDGMPGESYGRNVSSMTQNVSYYNPYFTTSEYYLTDPLNQNGVPAFYYEENSYIDQKTKNLHMAELIHAVDNLKFK